jgi:glycosyl transferase, family 25
MAATHSPQVPVFVINVESSPERYQHAEQQLLKLGVQPQRFNAIYGKNLSEREIRASYDKTANQQQFRRSLSLGEIGCYLSHRGVWQYMLDHHIEIAVVLEDDIEIDATFTQAINQLTRLQGWDHIKLSDDRNTPAYQTVSLLNGFTLANFKKVPNCATGYAIHL